MDELARKHGRVTLYTAEDRAFLEEHEEWSKFRRQKVLASRESALQQLVDAGICTPDGQLHPNYRDDA